MSLTDEAILRIKDMIVGGSVKPGGKLPREADLAESLGVSRNSLREAVRALALINILDVRQGDGTYVTSLDPGQLFDSMNFVVEFHQDDSVLEFLQVRRMLEPEATALACTRMFPAQFDELQRLVDTAHPDTPVEEQLALDVKFHRTIGRACGNAVLASLLDGLAAPTNRARIWRGKTQPDAYARTHAEHQAIVDALRTGDPALARAAMLLHVAGVEQWLAAATARGDRPPPS